MKKILLSIFALMSFTAVYAQDAPDFTVTDTHGTVHNLYADYLDKGKTVVLDMFFVDCPPCQGMAPFMEQAYQDYGGGQGDVQFISLTGDPNGTDNDAYVIGFEELYGLTFPAVSTDGGSLETIQPYINGTWGQFLGYPTIAVIAPDRSVTFDVWGSSYEDTYNLLIDAIAATGATGETGPEPLNITLPSEATCAGNSVVFTSNYDDATYSWDFPNGEPATSTEANPAVIYSSPGTYQAILTITDTDGTQQSTQIEVVVEAAPFSTVSLDENTGTATADMIESDWTYNWSNNATGTSVSGLEPGMYTLTVTNAAGCSHSIDFELTAVTGIEDINENNVNVVYFANENTVEVNTEVNLEQANIELVSLSGQLLQSEVFSGTKYQMQLNQSYPSSIYFIKVETEGKAIVKKISLR